MRLFLPTALIALTLVTWSSHAQGESWECGGAKIHCGGSPETCARLKQACTKEVMASSDVDRELARAVQDAQEGKRSSSDADPFERLARSMRLASCSEEEVKLGKCGVLYNAKELVSSVVDSIKFAVDAMNHASRVLSGQS